jgi:ABC-type sugar transport system substrate-binding protein
MKKRVLAGLLVSVMALSMLAGCGSKEEEAAAPAEEATEEAAEEATEEATEEVAGDVGKMTMILSSRDEFLSTLEAGGIKAAEQLGIELTTVDAQNDTSKLLQFVETARNDGQKAVIVNMVDPSAYAQVIEAAGDMKVVFVNRPPVETDGVLNENVVYVGSDENMSGKYQGDWLSEHFKAAGKTDIKYILLNGQIGNVSTTLRTESCLKALADNGLNAVEATAPLVADWDRATAQDMITPLLTTIEYDCIIGNNDAMALGAVEALKQQGLNPADVPIVGVDATVDGVAAVAAGEMSMTVFQNADGQGFGALMAAANLVNGVAVNDGTDYEVDETGFIVWVPFEPVYAENVADYQ